MPVQKKLHDPSSCVPQASAPLPPPGKEFFSSVRRIARYTAKTSLLKPNTSACNSNIKKINLKSPFQKRTTFFIYNVPAIGIGF